MNIAHEKVTKLGRMNGTEDFCDALSRGRRYHVARFSRWRTVTDESADEGPSNPCKATRHMKTVLLIMYAYIRVLFMSF